jgi:DNA polymerase
LEWLADFGVSDIIANEKISTRTSMANNSDRTAVKANAEITTLGELRDAISKVNISIRDCAANLVFGTGNEHADILFLGEAPGAEEDRQGLPFVGQSGQLLDKMLLAIGLDRTQVYITNILPWRPPGNRTPTTQEIALFRPYVLKHIAIIDPKIVVCLGSTATKALIQSNQSLTQMRNRWLKIAEINADIIATFHPAYLLRSPSQKREAWHDFLNIRTVLRKLVHFQDNNATIKEEAEANENTVPLSAVRV